MMRKVLDGALWGLGFWLVGGGLMLMFSAFNSHRQVERESDARAAQSGSVEDQWSRSEIIGSPGAVHGALRATTKPPG